MNKIFNIKYVDTLLNDQLSSMSMVFQLTDKGGVQRTLTCFLPGYILLNVEQLLLITPKYMPFLPVT